MTTIPEIKERVAQEAAERAERELVWVERLVRVEFRNDVVADQLLERVRREHPAPGAQIDALVDALQTLRDAK